MTIAALGISIEGQGVAEMPGKLDRVTSSAQRLESAADRLSKGARTADGALSNLSNRSLTGFNAISARAAEQAAYMAAQVEKLSMTDIRNDDIQAYGREMDQLRAKFNPLFAASKQYEASLDEINYAHRVGAITAQEQAAAVARLDAQYELAAQAANKLTTANKSMAGSFHTTNLLFQAQDIAMMTAMGQAPMMLALQQGMQVGGIFHQIGSGKQIVQALGGALAGLLSPINLVTVGVIALGAAAVQAFMSWVSSAGPVEKTMEDHRAWLDEILSGYEEISRAVDDYLERATRMPETLLRLDIGEQMTNAREQLDSLRSSLESFSLAYSSPLPFGPFQQFNEDMGILQQLRGEFVSGERDAVSFAESLRLIIQNNNVSPFVRELAQELYGMAREAAGAEVQLGSLEIAMGRTGEAALLAAQQTQFLTDTFAMLNAGAGSNAGLQNVMDEGVAALDTLRRMVPEIRNTKEIAGDLVQTVLDTLPSGAARQEAQALFDTILENEAILSARRDAARGAKSGLKEQSAYDDLILSANQFIETQGMEQQALALTGAAAAGLRYEQELLNKAANDNIALSQPQRDELAALAEAMAQAEQATAGVRFAIGDPDPWQQAITNIQNVDAALAAGALSWEQYGAAAFKANAGAASAVLGLASGMTGALAQMFQDNKAFAVANAVVSTAEAVMKAMATYGPTPWGFAAAGVAAATGAAQIASILSAQKGSSSVSRPSGSASSQSQTQAQAQRAVQLNVTLGGSGRYSRDEVRDLLEQLADGLNDGVDQGNFKIAVNS